MIVLGFIIIFILGVWTGVGLMCLLQVAKESDKRLEK